MNNINYSFLISGLAGLATMIGTVIIFFRFKNTSKVIGVSLAFAVGVMITICITDLIPSSYLTIKSRYEVIPAILIVSFFIIVGIIFSMFINKFIPSDKNNNKLFRTGILSMITLMLHNIPEGIVTFITSNNDMKFGIILAIAISFHNIPEGISIAVPIYYSTNSRIKALFYTFIAGVSELLGAMVAYYFLLPLVSDYFFSILYGIISGLMLYISINELLPTSTSYVNKKLIYLYMMFGSVLMFICHFML